MAANLPYIDRYTCITSRHVDEKELPEDKFCASLSNGSNWLLFFKY